MDGRAWWAAIYGVTQSRTWLKQLSSSSSKSYQVSILWYWWRDKHINDSKWRTHEKGPHWFTWFLTNVQKQFSGGGDSWLKTYGAVRHPLAKNKSWLTSHTLFKKKNKKQTSKCIHDLNIKYKTVKCLGKTHWSKYPESRVEQCS